MANRFRKTLSGLLVIGLATTIGCHEQSVEPDHPGPSSSPPGTPATPVRVDLDSRRPAAMLSDYHLFADLARQVPAPGVIPYELNSTSFIDGASQETLVYIPPGQAAGFQADGPFDFPKGTIFIQHLRFPVAGTGTDTSLRLIETRLLIHQNHGWTGVPYLWNEVQSDARRAVIGGKTELTLVGSDGSKKSFVYQTPNMNECKQCHSRNEQMVPIGTTARNLNRTVGTSSGSINQLQQWQQAGMLTGVPAQPEVIAKLPAWHDAVGASLDQRARAWLDANCAHCHNPRGPAIVSGLDLSFDQLNPVRFGIYKPPVAAGRGSSGHRFSILPGDPEKSFLLHRVQSTELGVMMPPIGRSTFDSDGVELLRQWITQIQPDEKLAEAALNPTAAYQQATSGGDPENGKLIFFETQKCINCHRVGSEGGEVGPNLSDVGQRTKPDYLLESIVDPNAKIVEGFQTEVVMTDDGRIVTGVVMAEDQYEVVIGEATATHKISKEAIEERQTSPNSTMPTMANLLTVQQVADLIAYLQTLQQPPVK
jgi:uncharacterized repeat protein (TIGR03806 family)